MIGFFSPPPPALQAAPPPFLASIPYDVDFSDAADAIGWEYAGEAVNGTISVSGGSLIYTRGSADGARPRIAVGISVVKGAQYTVTLPAPTGTAERKELWVSSDGGSFADALTPVAVNEPLVATFTAPVDGFGVVWIVMRAGTDSATGETVAISAAAMADAAIIASRYVLGFDGVDDHVRIPAVPATAAGTIAVDLWIPASVPADGFGIAYHQGRTGMAIEWSRAAGPGDVQIYAYGYQNSSFDEYLETALDSPQITFPVETWVRYVLTHGGGTYTEYLDGVAIRSGTTTGSLANPGTYGAIGAGNFSLSSTTAEFFGLQRLANVRDWDRKLTAGEVAAIDEVAAIGVNRIVTDGGDFVVTSDGDYLAATGAALQTSGLVRSYPLDEGTGSTAGNDGSAASADGTIIGASWVFVP